MARIFITGSSAGLGLAAGQQLAASGHDVVLHARSEERAADAREALPAAEEVVVGDIRTIQGSVALSEKVNALGRFDAVIHNAGIGYNGERDETADGLPAIFAVNSLAPYILTCLIERPQRLVYLSSGMHFSAGANLNDLLWQRRSWSGTMAYSESKLHDLLLAFAVARLWPDVRSNGVDPGWVPTRMGGPNAPDDLDSGAATQAALAAPAPGSAMADATGQLFRHLRPKQPNPQSLDQELQDRFLERCAEISGIVFR